MYRSLLSIFRLYWKDYGGSKEVLRSPFFHFSALFALLYKLNVVEFDWEGLSIQALPTILGFSLAAYTITFTLMGSALHRALTKAIDKKSGLPLISSVNATFFHVIVFQALALVFAISTKGYFFWRVLGGDASFKSIRSAVLWFVVNRGSYIGCLLSVYAIFLLFAVAIAMFRLGRLSSRPVTPPTVNSNDNTAAPYRNRSVDGTLRFKAVKLLAKILRVY